MSSVREKYRHVLRDWPKHSKTGLKTAALVGFAPNTRHLAPYDDDEVLIIGLNEGYNQGYMMRSNGQPRYDAWMQIHRYDDCTRRGNESDPNHPEWLRSEHQMPIYMQEEFEDIPNAIKFPLHEIRDRFIGNYLVRGNPKDETEDPIMYFTSTAAMGIGLLLDNGFERIELYGFNQATGTEYGGQRGSTESWIHIAVANKVQVFIPYASLLCRGKVYGWEYAMHIGRQTLEARSKWLQNRVDEKKGIVNNISGAIIELKRQEAAIKNQGTRDRLRKRIDELAREEQQALQVMVGMMERYDEVTGLLKHIDNQFGYRVTVDESGKEIIHEEGDEVLELVTTEAEVGDGPPN